MRNESIYLSIVIFDGSQDSQVLKPMKLPEEAAEPENEEHLPSEEDGKPFTVM
jgi:hypothetical protein